MKLPLLAWAIMLFQGFKPWDAHAFSHFAVEFTSITGYSKVMDASSKGVRDRLTQKFYESYSIVNYKELELECEIVDFLRWYEKLEDRPYDYSQIFGLALKALGLISFNKYGKNYKALTCNEVVLSMLENFTPYTFGDPDNYDLLMTWQSVKEL